MIKQGRTINRIMFVDNDPHVRGSLKAFFVNGPAEYLFFQSGADGLNSLKNNPADIVVSDYFLPDMDGISFLKRVGQIHGSTVRILMATLGDDSLVEESRQSGIERFIEKPINADTLDRMLKEFDLKFTN